MSSGMRSVWFIMNQGLDMFLQHFIHRYHMIPYVSITTIHLNTFLSGRIDFTGHNQFAQLPRHFCGLCLLRNSCLGTRLANDDVVLFQVVILRDLKCLAIGQDFEGWTICLETHFLTGPIRLRWIEHYKKKTYGSPILNEYLSSI